MSKAEDILRALCLAPHTEGGYYRETYRSGIQAKTETHRSAGTAIYFLLAENQQTSWHRVANDEIYHFYCGSPLEVMMISPDGKPEKRTLGCDILSGMTPQLLIPGGTWQSARCTGEFTLLGCTVSPGFEFADFEAAGSESMRRLFPHLKDFF